jgi:SAM-dependent methyltransferase
MANLIRDDRSPDSCNGAPHTWESRPDISRHELTRPGDLYVALMRRHRRLSRILMRPWAHWRHKSAIRAFTPAHRSGSLKVHSQVLLGDRDIVVSGFYMIDKNGRLPRAWAAKIPLQPPLNENSTSALHNGASDNVAAIYNQAGDDYVAYADGDPTRLFAFDGIHAYADRCVWALLEKELADLRASGASSVSLLDAGCGPGTWLRRLVTHARALGFTEITARGFDIAQAQIKRARMLARNLSSLAGVKLRFDVADLASPLPENDASIDITLCLYSVLSHLPVAGLADIAAEFARVTSGCFIATVRPIGSMPTAFVHSVETARQLKQDHARDRCQVELCDGRRIALNFHLFTASELTSYFASRFDIEDVRGLDLFHSRFAPDTRWNPECLGIDGQLSDELTRLEQAYATNP